VPGASGNTPIQTVALATGNQITNPQFSIVNFTPPFTLTNVTNQTISVAPGWDLVLTGTGNVTLDIEPLNDSATTLNPTNAPYALEINISGTWSAAVLRQRFNQNGMLWANQIVSSSITAFIDGAPQSISATLVDSNNTIIGQILAPTEIDGTFNEYTGFGQIAASTNPNLPPAAYVDYLLALPTAVDIFITSLQLVTQNIETVINYEQDSIERQVDHTFHYYKDSILLRAKQTILTVWNFPLNPWQFSPVGATTIASNSYITDQTILSQQNPGSISASRNTAGQLALTTVAATTQQNFAVIQYIDPFTIMPYWNYLLSSLVSAAITTSNSTKLNIKMKLIYSTTLPTTVDPIASWSGNEPVFTGQWTAINAVNQPVNVLSSGSFNDFAYNGFQLPAVTTSTMTLGVVFYTTSALNSNDIVLLNRISLVPNPFAIAANPQTFDQVLKECQFYYEKSYNNGTLPGNSAGGGIVAQQVTSPMTGSVATGGIAMIPRAFGFNFNTVKRTSAPTVTLYSPNSGTAARVYAVLFNGGSNILAQDANISNWTQTYNSSKNCSFIPNNVSSLGTSGSVTGNQAESYIVFHQTTDARLGLVA
jgi:hypothetical protein